MPSPAMTAMRCLFMDHRKTIHKATRRGAKMKSILCVSSCGFVDEVLFQSDIEFVLFLLRSQGFLLLIGKHVGLAPFVGQQEFLVLDHLAGRVNSPLEIVAMVDGVGGTGVHAETAENATAVIDLVDLGVTMVLPDAFGVRALVFGAFDVDG